MTDEFAVIKHKGGSKYGRWKITARFTIVTKTGLVSCVRLRPPNQGSAIYHTMDSFEEHFKIIKAKK